MMRNAVLTLPLLLAASVASAAEPAPNGDEFFEKEVRPLLVERCLKCHGEAKAKGDLRLTSRDRLLKAATADPPSRPASPTTACSSRPSATRTLRRCRRTGKLGDAEIGVLHALGRDGRALADDGRSGAAPAGASSITEEQRRFWSFQPVQGDGAARPSRTPRGTARRSTASSRPNARRWASRPSASPTGAC